MRHCHVAIVCLVLTASRVFGQNDPEQVVRAFFAAQDEGRWADAARLLDLSAFERIRQNALRMEVMRPKFATQTAEDLMKWEPDMPRAAAEWQIKKMNESMRDYDFLSRDFAHVTSLDSLRALPVAAAAARWIEAKSPGWSSEVAMRNARKMAAQECPTLSDSIRKELEQPFHIPRARILGSTQGSDYRYVVVGQETSPRPGAPQNEEAVTFGRSPSSIIVHRVAGIWKIIPTEDMPMSSGFAAGTVSVSFRCLPEKANADTAKKS